jgi:hypothetical protein
MSVLDHGREACLEAHRICLETVSYLSTSAEAAGSEDIRLLFNTAEICGMSAGLLRSSAGTLAGAYEACAELCEQSARYCERRSEDARLRDCASACRRCAEACRGLAARVA